MSETIRVEDPFKFTNKDIKDFANRYDIDEIICVVVEIYGKKHTLRVRIKDEDLDSGWWSLVRCKNNEATMKWIEKQKDKK